VSQNQAHYGLLNLLDRRGRGYTHSLSLVVAVNMTDSHTTPPNQARNRLSRLCLSAAAKSTLFDSSLTQYTVNSTITYTISLGVLAIFVTV